MATDDIFADDWRDCLRAHYSYVVRERDEVTLRTLVPVMNSVGFTDDELRALYLKTTMHVDDVADDFVPNPVHVLVPELPAPLVEAPPVPEPEPPVTPEEIIAADDEPDADEDDSNRYIPPPPQQLSLF